jgi:hypothetical protein
MIQIIIILVVLMGAGGFGGWSYLQKIEADNKVLQINQEVLQENELKLNDALASQDAVIAAKEAQAVAIQVANNILRVETDRLAKEKANLAKKLGRHQLDILAENKPGLVTRVINKAGRNALRCFEVLTGAPLTPKEEEASKPSQYNAECPTIHPNYNKPSEDS